MKPGAPWSVKGIEPQARETAKSAARRAGMTLGEWLNNVILKDGEEGHTEADPIRDPESWKRETGAELPWTGPIDALSSSINAHLQETEARSTARLKHLEGAIGTIAERLVKIDQPQMSGGSPEMEGRLQRVEERQKGTLSKDHLKSLEAAVGQISVVLENSEARQNERFESSDEALARLEEKLSDTENKVIQAISAVDAAADLYEITDRQGQMIDSLVMDVAALHAHQKEESNRHRDDVHALAADITGLRDQFAASETNMMEALSAPASGAKEAAERITGQIAANEERTAASVEQIEAQLENLAGVLDTSLSTRDSGLEELRLSLSAINERLDTLESQKAQTPVEMPAEVPAREIVEEPANDVARDQSAATIKEHEPSEPVETPKAKAKASPIPPITFRSLRPDNNDNVSINLAVSKVGGLVKTLEVSALEEDPVALPDTQNSTDAGQVEEEGYDFAAELNDALDDGQEDIDEAETKAAPEISESLEIISESDLTIDVHTEDLFDISAKDFEDIEEQEILVEVEVEDEKLELAEAGDHEPDIDEVDAKLIDNEPISIAEIFGNKDKPEGNETEDRKSPRHNEDEALKVAQSTVPTMRASWAAKSEATGRSSSIRQVAGAGDAPSSRRGWALTASAVAVTAAAISASFLWPSDKQSLVSPQDRPGLMAEVSKWFGKDEPVSATTSEEILPISRVDFTQGLTAAAEAGDAKAQFALARAYATGEGRPIDRQAAIKWYQAAADQGLAIAQYALGSLHERGIDLPENKAKAIDWYAAAARSGNRRAMHNLAVAYAQGQHVAQDLDQAAYWFTEAAGLGFADAQYNLALLFERGLGVPKDPQTAYKWYAIALANGDKSAVGKVEALGASLPAEDVRAADELIATWQAASMDPIANGLFDIAPAAYDNAERRTAVATVQYELTRLGYSIRAEDGIMDPSTQAAIRAFEARTAMDITGKVSPGLVESLSVAK